MTYKSNPNHGPDGRFSSGDTGSADPSHVNHVASAKDFAKANKNSRRFSDPVRNRFIVDNNPEYHKAEEAVGKTLQSEGEWTDEQQKAFVDAFDHESDVKNAAKQAINNEVGPSRHFFGLGPQKKKTLSYEFFATAREFKFTTESLPPGEFKGYGAIFGNVDSHGDIIEPGAFGESLAKRASDGRPTVPMHVMHSIYGGDGLPIGKWISVEEDGTGLRVHGKVSGIDTEAGKLHLARIADGAYGGLSIGYSVPKDGSEQVKASERHDGAKRLLKKVDLHEISLVDEPSNAMARFDEFKAARLRRQRKGVDPDADDEDDEVDPDGDNVDQDDVDSASAALAAYMDLHDDCMLGGDSPTADERVALLNHVQDAHEALTGRRTSDPDAKIVPSTRVLEKALRRLGLTHTQARDFAAAGLKKLHLPREEGRGLAKDHEGKSAAETARSSLSFLER